MQRITSPSTRREFLGQLATLATAATVAPRFAAASAGPMLTRPIPATGEQVPVIGMGSWITFNVGDDQDLRDQRVQVLQSFFDRGGALINSSPMYGSSEEVIGHCLARIGKRGPLFSATKVWTPLQMLGPGQMGELARALGRRALRSDADPQPFEHGGSPRDAARGQGRGPDPLHRDHHLPRPAP